MPDKDQNTVERYHVVSLTGNDSNVPRTSLFPVDMYERYGNRPSSLIAQSGPNGCMRGLVLRERRRHDGGADEPSSGMSFHDKPYRIVGQRDDSYNARVTYKFSPQIAVGPQQA